jgi:hypothetical protein
VRFRKPGLGRCAENQGSEVGFAKLTACAARNRRKMSPSVVLSSWRGRKEEELG